MGRPHGARGRAAPRDHRPRPHLGRRGARPRRALPRPRARPARSRRFGSGARRRLHRDDDGGRPRGLRRRAPAPALLGRRALDGRARGHCLRRQPARARGAPHRGGHRARHRARRPAARGHDDGPDARALRRPRDGHRLGAGGEPPLHRHDAPPPGRPWDAAGRRRARVEVRPCDPRRRPVGTMARSRGPLAALERDRLPDAGRPRRGFGRARAGDRQANARDESPRAPRRGGRRRPYGAGRSARDVPPDTRRIPRRLTASLRLLWIGAFAFFLSFFLLLAVLPLYARAVGIGDRAIGGVLGAFAFAAMLVRPWAGWASDRHGRRPLMLAGGVVFVAASLAFSLPPGLLRLLPLRPLPCPPGARVSADALIPPASLFLVMLGYGALVTFLPIHAEQQDVNPGLFFFVFALVVTAVRNYAGQLSDRFGRVVVAVGGLVLAATALAGLALTSGATSLMAAGALYGVGFGGLTTAPPAWGVDVVGAANPGLAMGTYYTALELGLGLGSLGARFGVEAVGFAVTFLSPPATTLPGAVLAVHRRPAQAGRNAQFL